jgi:hypothetical protein
VECAFKLLSLCLERESQVMRDFLLEVRGKSLGVLLLLHNAFS